MANKWIALNGLQFQCCDKLSACYNRIETDMGYDEIPLNSRKHDHTYLR